MLPLDYALCDVILSGPLGVYVRQMLRDLQVALDVFRRGVPLGAIKTPARTVHEFAHRWFRLELEITQRGGYDMPSNRTARQNDFQGFIEIRLQDAHKDEIEDLLRNGQPSPEDLLAWMGDLAYSQYKFSISRDDYSGSLQVGLFCWQANDPNFGHAISARHGNLYVTLATLWYKHERIAGGDWSSVGTKPAPGTWG